LPLVAKPTSPGLLAIKNRGDALRREGEGTKGRLVVKQTVDRFHHRVLDVDANPIGKREGADAQAGGRP
jgi:hypothetical protein